MRRWVSGSRIRDWRAQTCGILLRTNNFKASTLSRLPVVKLSSDPVRCGLDHREAVLTLATEGAINPQDGAGAGNPDGDRYVISIKQVAKFVVGLGDRVSPTDVEEGMRVG